MGGEATMNEEYKENDHVRISIYHEDHINAYARVSTVYPDGALWLVNMNMPFAGTINRKFSKEEVHDIIT